MTGKWYDEKCSESGYGFVCQKLQGEIHLVSLYLYFIHYLNSGIFFLSLLLLGPRWRARLSDVSCPLVIDTSKAPTHSYHHPLPASIEYRGHNYRVISGNLSWYNAMVMCRENHSDLVSIMDAYHQAFLTVLVNRLGTPHWIGLHSEMAVCILLFRVTDLSAPFLPAVLFHLHSVDSDLL